MGSCVSSTTKHPETADKFILNNNIGSLSDKLVMPSPINADRPIIRELSHNSHPSRNFGSKEENFFDSQAWLDSDCDDDFLSVNGELTPSHGDTPAHGSFASGVPQVNKVLLEGSDPGGGPESSPPDKKTRLSDLFKDSLQELDEHCISGNVSERPIASGVDSTERTLNRKKSTKAVQCCLPSLRRPSPSFSHRKKMSPYDNIG